eukprot:3908677-Rhodomonas_salina.1
MLGQYQTPSPPRPRPDAHSLCTSTVSECTRVPVPPQNAPGLYWSSRTRGCRTGTKSGFSMYFRSCFIILSGIASLSGSKSTLAQSQSGGRAVPDIA